MSGSSASNQEGNYGIQGVTSNYNTPTSRLNGLGWTDLNGNLWLFGGSKSSKTKGYSNMNSV
jgi:hypothetical protein